MTAFERRKFTRVDIDFVTVEVYDSEQIDASAHVAEICNVENISEDGMLFTAEHQFQIKQVIRLTFLLPESIVIIRTDAIVAHIKKVNSKTNSIGVQFQKLGESERRQIRHFINKIIVEKAV